ncbi:hypothetical protein MKX01_027524 [Papaver californicum]|nr:hypothetical protein MKX01_027524 [Papaver californicum]
MESIYHYEEPPVDKDWERTINKVLESVVELTIKPTRRFDVHEVVRGTGTGFVVDKKRGIILTNRHVARTGPVLVDAKFSNGEEFPVLPLYVDPVHDFAFLRYCPDEVESLDCEEIPIAPESVYVGMEICIVGSFSERKVATLACMDRDAPLYRDNYYYNDFDTFYMQARAVTERGSSGSPVVDKQGRAIGLNSGMNADIGAGLLLPLERVARALSFIQKGYKDSSGIEWEAFTVPRGTLQATFLHKSFLEARRIHGLKIETEQMARDTLPHETGVLVVDSVVPDGPADKHLELGDVLFKVNGEVTTQFLKLEIILDENVGQEVDVMIQRGDKLLTVNLMVQDFHSITPNCFLEIGGSVIQPLPYQLARNLNIKCRQVYVAAPGYMLSRAEVPCHSIIRKCANREITKLDDFILVLSAFPCGARVPLEYENLHRRSTESVLVTVDVEPQWYPAPLIYTRNDCKGLWTKEFAFSNKSIHNTYKGPFTNLVTSHESMEENLEIARHEDDPEGAAANASVVERLIKLINPSLVAFEVYFPRKCMIDGMKSLHSSGTGVIVYHSKSWGLVAIDKVPMSACDVMLSFAAFPTPKEIIGEVVFIHPVHSYALVTYDHSSLGQDALSVRVAEVVPVTEPGLKEDDSVYLVGLSGDNQQAVAKFSTVTSSKAVITIATASDRFSGVLSDERGYVHAIWGRFNNKHDQGIPMYAVSEVAKKITCGDRGLLVKGIRRPLPLLRILEVEFCPFSIRKAKKFGLSEKWVQVLEDKDPKCKVLCVKRCLDGSKAGDKLQRGDMVLEINEVPVTCYQDVENARQGLEEDGNGTLGMTICRQVEVIKVPVETDLRDGSGITRLISWCGYFVREPPRAVKLGGVYVDGWCKGSPAQMFCPTNKKCIVEVNGKPTLNLDSFLEVATELEQGELVSVRAVRLNETQEEFTLEVDDHYWPLWELEFYPSTGIWNLAW